MDILEILGKMGFDWKMALANLFNFLIIFWLLKKYAWGPIRKTIEERESKIQKGLDDAKKAASEVTMAEENYEKKINEAKKEANLVIAKATKQGRDIVNKSTAEAGEKTEKLIQEAKAVIGKEKDKMIKEVKKETVEIGVAIAEKILKEKVDDKKLISKLVN